MTRLHVAVVGGGWAGLAAAVQATRCGHHVTLFEMAPRCGGRARSTLHDGLDNGQHILIGAYRQTLQLMRSVGVDPRQVLLQLPLQLRMADGTAFDMPPGPPALAFAWAVLRCRAWTWPERLSLLALGGRWAAGGFDCAADLTVDELCRPLPTSVRQLLIDPLCVAALNTPAAQASAAVFLRVLRDGLFGGPGASDLLLPRRPLQDLFPTPAVRWLQRAGARVRTGHRVTALEPWDQGWRLEGQRYDRVVLACSAREAARLARPLNPSWADRAERLRYEPIVTVWVQHGGLRCPAPMLALHDGLDAPAQFVFDHARISGRPGLLAGVVSGAARWLDAGLESTARTVLGQLQSALAPPSGQRVPAAVVAAVAERRATFSCTPGLMRPPADIARGLWAAGDHVEGPYPATLEGAVRSGLDAAFRLDA